MIGDSIGVFLAHYDSFLRLNRLTDAEFAARINETEWTISCVRDRSIEPPDKMLDVVGWVKFRHSYYKSMLVEETRYLERERAQEDE